MEFNFVAQNFMHSLAADATVTVTICSSMKTIFGKHCFNMWLQSALGDDNYSRTNNNSRRTPTNDDCTGFYLKVIFAKWTTVTR